MTGLYGPRTGHVGHIDNLVEAQSVDCRLREGRHDRPCAGGRGYATAVAGKWQHGGEPGRVRLRSLVHLESLEPGRQDLSALLGSDASGGMGSRRRSPAEAYGPDIIADWTIDFFRHPPGVCAFVLHNELLAHTEGGSFSPTPDDPTPSLKGSLVYWTQDRRPDGGGAA